MPRASWRGYLRLSLVSCPIYLSPAAARTKPIRLHQVWRGAPGDDGSELEDQVGGQDVPDQPMAVRRQRDQVAALLPGHLEDLRGRAAQREMRAHGEPGLALTAACAGPHILAR